MESKSIIQTLSSVLFPKDINLHFEISEVKEHKDYIIIRLDELKELVPKELQGVKEIILDGFCNPIELQSFPLKGKAVYLKLYRRKWKAKGSNYSYWNSYELNPEGVKATKEFAVFLKETFGQTPDEYNADSSSLMRGE
jgi:hypothetical protein